MAAIQLNFTLRTSANCKTVHLLGSWDNYAGQLPLSKDASKAGGWKGTFRFQGSTLKQGQRYWYYYIIDGYHVSHNPSEESTTEPTTGRELNILDVPSDKSSSKSSSSSSSKSRSSSGVLYSSFILHGDVGQTERSTRLALKRTTKPRRRMEGRRHVPKPEASDSQRGKHQQKGERPPLDTA